MNYQVCENETGARCVKLPRICKASDVAIRVLEVPTRGRVRVRRLSKVEFKKFKVVDWFALPVMYAVLCLAAKQYGAHKDALDALAQMAEDLPAIKDNMPDNGDALYLITKQEINKVRKEGKPLPEWEFEATPTARKATAEGRSVPEFPGVKDDPRRGMTEKQKKEYDALVAQTPPWEPLPEPKKRSKRPVPPVGSGSGKPPPYYWLKR